MKFFQRTKVVILLPKP